ncbi:hypothetical protein CAPN001_24110 [Capnocytophaga stomatis]|uniref:hypothetical protein n=1 Tax=Capnocytophaga stomatis TaxID=1848904 RepID=UPI00194F7552|nr:hypothetical protein [Capnocytophaga stomatis]GIJ97842.1 hypothetical protein CAPN001_24110 [Capnocytophaga stomatis]
MNLFNLEFDPNLLKKILSKIELTEIERRIREFERLNFEELSVEKLFMEILKTILIDCDGISRAYLEPIISIVSQKTRFYRIRPLDSQDLSISVEKVMRYEQDAWNPPIEKVTKIGRLNKINESLLYTCLEDPSIAMEETKVKEGEYFCLVVYEAISEIKMCVIGEWQNSPELNEEENLKMYTIAKFLKDEFAKDVVEGTEYFYRSSEIIAKSYFDLPPDFQDAWCYPSVAAKRGFNVCFRPEKATKSLKLVGVQICEAIREDNSKAFISRGFGIVNDKNEFVYTKLNEQNYLIYKHLFPEMSIHRD